MKTLNFKTSEAAAIDSGAMEVDTISKNGRSSKSLMSRKHFLSYFVIAALVVSAAFTSCGSRGSGGSGGSVSGNTPSSAVKKALNAYVKKDAEEVFKYYYNLLDYQKERLRYELENDNDYSLVKFEIQDERIFDNGEKAEVIVKVFAKNGSEQITKMPLVKTSSGWKLVQN